MCPNNPKNIHSLELYGQSWKKTSNFKGLFARILLILTLLMSFIIPTHSIIAAPVITNTATATFSINGVAQQLSDSIQFTKDNVVKPTDVLELNKISNVDSALIGENIQYSLMLNNPNPRPLSNVTISDVLPTGLVYTSNSATLDNVTFDAADISVSANTINFTIGHIAANTDYLITYETNVSESTPFGIASNKAIATSDTATSSQAQVDVTIVDPIKPTIPLIMSKVSEQSNAAIGDTISFTLSIENNNAHVISDAVVNDVLPEGLTYVIGSAKYNNSTFTANLGTMLTFTIGDVSGNSTSTITYDARIDSNATSGIPLINTANITATDTAANSNTAAVSVNIVNDVLALTKTTTSSLVKANDIVDYTISLSNTLDRDLSNLVIKDILPAGFNYQIASARINNVPLASSDVSVNGTNIDFAIGTLASSASIILDYKALVTDNATPGDNINAATAMSDFAASNTVTATVKVRTPSVINFYKIDDAGIETIIQPTSYNTNQQGGKNFEEITSIPLANGSTISLPTPQPIIPATQYSLGDPVVIEVIDLDQNTDPTVLDTIEVTITIPGTNDTENLLLTETSPNSGIFIGIIETTTGNTNVQDGAITIADGVDINVTYSDEVDSTDISATAALVVPNTALKIDKSVDKEYSAVGELLRYSLEITNTKTSDLSDLKVHDLLPIGFIYSPDSAELNGNPISTGVTFDGRSITFNFNSMPADSVWKIDYVTKITSNVIVGDAINTAYAESHQIRSNTAKAVVKIKDDLMRSKNILTGRVYIGCKTNSSKDQQPPAVLGEARIFMETGRSVLSDAEGFWHMEGVQPGAHVLQLDTESIPGYEPILCNDNTRRARDSKSHFVDLEAGSLWHVDFHVKAVEGYIAKDSIIEKETAAIDPMKRFDKSYLETASEGFEILWPANNYVPDVASTQIVIKSSPKHKVALFLNGKKVNPLNYDGSNANAKRTVNILRWKGVDIDIKNKNNTLLAIFKDKKGNEVARKTHNIHFSGKPTSAEILLDQSILIADGKTSPIITLRVKDEDGFPMRANTQGYFTLQNSKYSVKTQKTSNANKSDLNESLSGSYKYEIRRGGIARIELNPTTQSGQIKLNLQFQGVNTEQKFSEISAWLKPALRKWILVGLAEGSVEQELIAGNMKALSAVGKNFDLSKRGRVAFFAKGQIQGKYLLTIAYDTHKNNREVGSQLNGNIDPDEYYTIYADNSNSQYDAPSSEKLYLKIEKDNFYALFGDYQTDMSVTELAQYQRTLNGIKTEYKGERYAYKAFISETSNNHQQQEIPGDGTSGLYKLDHKIIPNSDTIAIETRDRFHSDKIIVRRELRRYHDYNIDYDAGTLFFKFPVASRDSDFNPNTIVVNYDSEEDTNKSISAGGRVSVTSKDGKLETGLSYLHEGKSNADDNTLVATDLTYDISTDTELRVELAESKTAATQFNTRHAYVIELKKDTDNIDARIYAKKHESGFGINTQASENGTTKIGAELNYKIDQKTKINSEVSVQKNLVNDNERRLAQIKGVHNHKQYAVSVGLRHTQETLDADNTTSNDIINSTVLLGGQYTTDNNKVTLRTDLEKNISDESGSEVSPDRLVVGIDVKLAHGFKLFAENETTDNGNVQTNNSRAGLSKSLWVGAKGKTTYTQERTDQGQRNYATLGLSQSIKLSDKLSADLSIDKAKTITDTQAQDHFNESETDMYNEQRDDYTAFSVGLGSNDKEWSWTTRTEYRDGDLYDKVNFLGSTVRHYSNGKDLSAKLSYNKTDFENGNYEENIKLSFGSAWHPKEKDFVFLSRLDLIGSKSSSTTSDNNGVTSATAENDTQKIVHNMHYNRKLNPKTQLSIHHGIKYVKDNSNSTSSSSFIDTASLRLRRDINKHWDIGVHGGYINAWDSKNVDYVAGVSLGANPTKNVWVELGYNVEGFDDSDFDNNSYTKKGVYLDFRYKFDQNIFRGIKKLMKSKND